MNALRSILMASLVALAGMSFAAVTTPSYNDTGTPSQAQPVDCKKTPNDPACKGKKP